MSGQPTPPNENKGLIVGLIFRETNGYSQPTVEERDQLHWGWVEGAREAGGIGAYGLDVALDLGSFFFFRVGMVLKDHSLNNSGRLKAKGKVRSIEEWPLWVSKEQIFNLKRYFCLIVLRVLMIKFTKKNDSDLSNQRYGSTIKKKTSAMGAMKSESMEKWICFPSRKMSPR